MSESKTSLFSSPEFLSSRHEKKLPGEIKSPNKNSLRVFVCLFVCFIYLFIFGCVGSSLLRAGFLQLRQAGATLHCGAQVSHCGGFSCCGAWALGTWASVAAAHRLSSCGSQALERRLSSCGTWAQLLRSMWDLPRAGFEPVSPVLAGGFLTTAPPGKSLAKSLNPNPWTWLVPKIDI